MVDAGINNISCGILMITFFLSQQGYVLLFGLDVIGNPFGLVVGVTRSVEDLFYEPFQGDILFSFG